MRFAYILRIRSTRKPSKLYSNVEKNVSLLNETVLTNKMKLIGFFPALVPGIFNDAWRTTNYDRMTTLLVDVRTIDL